VSSNDEIVEEEIVSPFLSAYDHAEYRYKYGSQIFYAGIIWDDLPVEGKKRDGRRAWWERTFCCTGVEGFLMSEIK
jgi:hypothetical protein